LHQTGVYGFTLLKFWHQEQQRRRTKGNLMLLMIKKDFNYKNKKLQEWRGMVAHPKRIPKGTQWSAICPLVRSIGGPGYSGLY